LVVFSQATTNDICAGSSLGLRTLLATNHPSATATAGHIAAREPEEQKNLYFLILRARSAHRKIHLTYPTEDSKPPQKTAQKNENLKNWSGPSKVEVPQTE